MRYVVCYDIASDDRRRRLAECLDGYGDRVQESVFELVLDTKLFEKCIADLDHLLEVDEDSVVAYALCKGCEDRSVRLGLGRKRSIGNEKVFIV